MKKYINSWKSRNKKYKVKKLRSRMIEHDLLRYFRAELALLTGQNQLSQCSK